MSDSIHTTTDSLFEPGDGWREVDQDEWYKASHFTLALEKGKNDEHARYWVRETPVPALPTEPGYYLATNGSVYRLGIGDEEPVWDDTFGNPQDEVDLTGRPFVAIEPRTATAKVVLDRVRYELRADQAPHVGAALDGIATEFGVES